jgi:hypothetical protein
MSADVALPLTIIFLGERKESSLFNSTLNDNAALFIRLIIRFFSFFFQPEQNFSLTTNQSTVFFSRLISTAERALHFEARLCLDCNFFSFSYCSTFVCI